MPEEPIKPDRFQTLLKELEAEFAPLDKLMQQSQEQHRLLSEQIAPIEAKIRVLEEATDKVKGRHKELQSQLEQLRKVVSKPSEVTTPVATATPSAPK